ncbi:hypothetical protein ACHAXT_002745 [Thalassiosira profunda]
MLPAHLSRRLAMLCALAATLLSLPSHHWARAFSNTPLVSPRRRPSAAHVYDNVASPKTCQLLHELTLESTQRGTDGSFVFRRGQNHRRLTPIETAIDQLLTSLNDTSTIVEYWSRAKYINLDAHADIDENALKEDGILRCPRNGHVLYMQVADNSDNEKEGRAGPTVVFPNRRVAWGTVTARTVPSDSSASFHSEANVEERCVEYIVDVENYWDDEQKKQYGYDEAEQTREKEEMAIVPAVTGRLLRFDGAAFHAVPKPPDRYLLSEKELNAFLEKECEEDCDDEDSYWDDGFDEYDDEDEGAEEEEESAKRRSGLLFNTWPEGSNGPRGVNPDTVVREVPDGIVLDDGDAIDDRSLEEERWRQWPEDYGEGFEQMRCNPFEEWFEMEIQRPRDADCKDVIVPLMGNPARRGCQSNRDVLKGAIDSGSFYDGQRVSLATLLQKKNG